MAGDVRDGRVAREETWRSPRRLRRLTEPSTRLDERADSWTRSGHMRTFYMNEAALLLPDNAVDRTMTHVLLTTPSGVRATFVVERLELPLGQTLREARVSYTREVQTRLLAFSTLFEREGSVDGAPALEIGARWRNDGGEMRYTRQAHLGLEESWMILGIEGPLEVREELDGIFDPILASVQFRSG
jgi:hypothetical protein